MKIKITLSSVSGLPRGAWIALALILVPLAYVAADEAVVDGDMGTLDGWGPARVFEDSERKLLSENSAFTEVYPSNSSCLVLREASGTLLTQPFSPREGVLIWSFDFRIPSQDSEKKDAGYLVALTTEGERHSQVSISRTIRFNQFIGVTGESGWVSPRKFEVGTDRWWHFQCEIDTHQKVMRVFLRSEDGEEMGSEPLRFPEGEAVNRSQIDGMILRSASGAGATSTEMHFDNFSLRSVTAE